MYPQTKTLPFWQRQKSPTVENHSESFIMIHNDRVDGVTIKLP